MSKGESMNFKSLTILIVAIALLFGFSALSGQADKYKALLGKWDVEADAGGQVMNFVFEFSMEDDEISGKMSFQMGDGVMSDIEFDGKELSFTVTFDANGQQMEVDGTATIEGDQISGTLTSPMGEAPFEGAKVKEEEK